MELDRYVTNLREQLAAAAEAGGEDGRAMAQRLVAPLDGAVRLTLLEALSDAAAEITRELAPGSVDLRLRGGEPEFVVASPPAGPAGGAPEDGEDVAAAVAAAGEANAARINLRLPDGLKRRVEQAADREGLSTNAWLVRAVAAAVERGDGAPRPAERRDGPGGRRYTGWGR